MSMLEDEPAADRSAGINPAQNRDRSRSRDSRIQLGREEEKDASTYAKVDHFSKNRQRNKPPIPKEVLEIEEQLFQLRDKNARLEKELEQKNENNDNYKAKIKAIELYASEIQRKYDKLENEHNQQKIAFEELIGQDWAKRVIVYKNQINQLRMDLSHKENQFQDLKKRVNLLLNKDDSGAYLKTFFERQTNDLLYTKKIISEYEKRENECTKRWNDLLNENNGLKVQLNRQRETYQSVMAENDRRLAEANDRIADSYDDHEKRKAAEFLATQIELLKEERRALLEDIDVLNLKINDLMLENDNLKHAHQLVGLPYSDEQVYGSEEEEKIKRMFRRIEELEDLVVQEKQKSGVNRIIDLEAQISVLNYEIEQKSALNESLQSKLVEQRKKEISCYDESESLNYFSALIKEKDEKIKTLTRKLNEQNLIAQERKRENYEKLVQDKEISYKENEEISLQKGRLLEIMKENHFSNSNNDDDRNKWIVEEESMTYGKP
ncbi:unnamed protein product [Moneuplotes crassus]|uniref:Uncharacterized protein n=2 Tax=Euplotes crassus TaxID=5936 RepID=A0AAD1UCW6_EUPCR|nr:unnamed protein product [Moneuplotes crassus]